ncbi:MAG TPA: DNA-formamidopyrimidine glycosylase family protein [Flavisolibacter sp.]|jgi:formamidopyrimidine-DNA glycosylase|nr:DNA-formamidopyrimidine glycosylase family protein [Flavisolibacter sp.]
MPEIPDIEVFCRNLKQLLAGKQVANIKVVNGKKLKDDPTALSKALEGQNLLDVYRSGKELRMKFSKDVMLGIHLMLTGDLHLFDKTNERKSTIVEMHFKDGSGIALTDRMKNAAVTLNPVDKAGIDALDKALNFKKLKEIFDRKAAIKNVLLDQDLIRGIGNSYSDEILWETRISPFSKANAVPDEKIKELASAIKKVLKGATEKIYKNHPGKTHGEVKDYLQIHTKKKTESPTGSPILTAERGMLTTYYTDEQVVYE